MPAPEDLDRVQRAVYWPYLGVDEFGSIVVGEPQEIDVRWTINRTGSFDKTGNRTALDAKANVPFKLPLGSRLWLAPNPTYSALEQFYGTGSAGDYVEIMEVKTQSESPDLKGMDVMHSVGMLRFESKPHAPMQEKETKDPSIIVSPFTNYGTY